MSHKRNDPHYRRLREKAKKHRRHMSYSYRWRLPTKEPWPDERKPVSVKVVPVGIFTRLWRFFKRRLGGAR